MAITQRGSVIFDGANGSEQFGHGICFDSTGTVLIVGAYNASNQGRVWTFDWNPGTAAWVQRGSVLAAVDAENNDNFGNDVALSGDGLVLAVSAQLWDGSVANQGGVYIYDWDVGTSAWVQRGSVLIETPTLFGFGSSVSLSDDGGVLVVGAQYFEGIYAGQGGVYIYDWDVGTSAWVQRGSVLTAPDPVASGYFGNRAKISSGATVLAVASYNRYGGVGRRGGVYIYDWDVGTSAWVQRGSVLTADSTEDFGYGLALSGDALVLVVGSPGRDVPYSNQGGVYIYDWDVGTSAWVQRGSVLTASDGEATDAFGAAAALNGSGTVISICARNWEPPAEGSSSNWGGVYVYDYEQPNSGTAAAHTALIVDLATAAAEGPTALTVTAEGMLSAQTDLTVQIAEVGAPTAPAVLTVSWLSGAALASAALTVTAEGAASAATLLATIPASHVPHWTARCLVDGVDVSARLVGQASVTADEGAARIATVVLQPPAGAIAPLDYVGKTLWLDYVLVIDGVDVPRRMFSGVIDTPRYDPNTTLLTLECVDDLQNRVAALDRATIDWLVGGRYSAAVQGEILDNWDYALERLSTVAASLDAGASGGMRVTPWKLATAWVTYGVGDLLYERCRLQLPQRSTLVNKVAVEFQYRYPRLRQRAMSVGWSGTQIDMAPVGYQYPTQQDVLGAAGGSGWTVTRGVFFPAPAAIPYGSGYIYPPDGAIDMAILHLAQRHSQTVTETYSMVVSAPESITANGELPHSIRGALSSKFDGTAWEAAIDVAPLMPEGGDMDWSPDAPRADSDYAIQTLLDQANTKILGSHRSARVSNAVLCNPDLDLDKRVDISTPAVSASGKVASVVHTLDFDLGSAITEFSIACFGVGGAGIITPDTLVPPSSPAEAHETQDWRTAVPPLFVNCYGITPYSDNMMGLILNPPETITVEDIPGGGSLTLPNPHYVAGSYPVTGFRVSMPGVADGDRNPLDRNSSASYQLAIPSDTLIFTVP